MSERSERQYEIVVLGATGFTGSLTAEYLASNAPPGTRWALAGRDQQKLETLRSRLAQVNPACGELPILQADINDQASIAALARAANVVLTTVGPYILYGEPVVAACAAAGTDYVDLTGEPEFVDLMWLRYHQQAQAAGARIVHCCGFDSIPYDLGALFTVNQLPEGVPIELQGFGLLKGTFSGGTYHSAINAMGRLRQSAKRARERRAREERPADRQVKGRGGMPHNEPSAGGWVVPAPLIDPQVVLRSARALDRYGPAFTYSHYLVAGKLTSLAVLLAGAGVGLSMAQFAPTRNLLLKLKSPGEGPDAAQRARSYFRVRFVGNGGGKTVITQLSGGDPGYGETSKMLAQSALCLAHDELPDRAGQLTTAVAMGQALIDRLRRAGIEFRVLQAA
ncbi:MAG: saccharopine dehydrogenase family protein [Solirubrobacteraceae bacterium]